MNRFEKKEETSRMEGRKILIDAVTKDDNASKHRRRSLSFGKSSPQEAAKVDRQQAEAIQPFNSSNRLLR